MGDLGLILGREDPQEEGMATHSSVFAWRIPWTEEPGGRSLGPQRVGRDWLMTKHSTALMSNFPGGLVAEAP